MAGFLRTALTVAQWWASSCLQVSYCLKKFPWKDTSLHASLKLHQHITQLQVVNQARSGPFILQMDESNDASSDRVCIVIRHYDQEARVLKNDLPKMIAGNTAGAGNISASLDLFYWLQHFSDKCDCTFPSLNKYSVW